MRPVYYMPGAGFIAPETSKTQGKWWKVCQEKKRKIRNMCKFYGFNSIAEASRYSEFCAQTMRNAYNRDPGELEIMLKRAQEKKVTNENIKST